ncbi:MAG: type II secretion system F family protein [Candidatus Xenobiia bacterium LiM19]
MDLTSFLIGLFVFLFIAAMLFLAVSRVSGSGMYLNKYNDSLIVFTRQCARMLSMNLPLIEALEHLKVEIESNVSRGKDRMAEVIPFMIRDLRQGLTLSQSAARYPQAFPPIYSGLVSVGERNEKLPAVLEETALFMERSNTEREKLIEILVYPSTVLIFLIGVIEFMVYYILPTFVSLFEGMQVHLPLVTGFVITVARAGRNPVIISSLLFAFVSVIIISLLWERHKGYFLHDCLVLKLPLIGKAAAMKEYAAFSGLMGSLLAASVPLSESLTLAASALDNSYIRSRIIHVAAESQSTLSAALRASGVFQPSYLWMVLAGERTEALDHLLMEMGQFYGDESRLLSTQILGWLHPLLLVTAGVFTAVCTTSVFLPLVQIVVTITKDIVL